ncbi:hypothetical protein F1C10_11065 [Sphingomonas sp. NBWT7]|uniref:hypothetical protein n=1 Tax=Sphingomonas sp. NBWT7 TaxID=2596913 RepID=UPI001628B150|nr:hypothetical protein [Sphingomonas sp. NBWT7]QNE32431.1 hypothetical protein F1C10_11065 [Sphingomonas sp. NBWT7]
MTRQKLMAAAVLGLAVPSPALASETSVRLVARIPVSCALDILGVRLVDRSVIVTVYRQCNTAHDLKVSAAYQPELGAVTVRFGGQSRVAFGIDASIPQSEGYYSRTEELTVTADKGSAEELHRYASSLSIGVEPN